MCCSASPKYTPSISLEDPSPSSTVSTSARASRAPNATPSEDGGVPVEAGALHREVGHAVAVLLEGDVADPAARAGDDLDDRVRQRVGQVRRGVPVDERHLGPDARHDQRVREDRRPVGVDPGEGLEREPHLHLVRDVQERAPCGRRRAGR